MGTVNTKIVLWFSNEEKRSVDLTPAALALGLDYNKSVLYTDTQPSTSRLNANYLTITLLKDEALILDGVIDTLTKFLSTKKELITESCARLNANAGLSFILKMHEGQTPGLTFSNAFLATCAEAKLEIDMDMYIF